MPIMWHPFTFTHLADAFIQSNIQRIQAIHFLSVCVPCNLNPEPFALLTQCSSTYNCIMFYNVL